MRFETRFMSTKPWVSQLPTVSWNVYRGVPHGMLRINRTANADNSIVLCMLSLFFQLWMNKLEWKARYKSFCSDTINWIISPVLVLCHGWRLKGSPWRVRFQTLSRSTPHQPNLLFNSWTYQFQNDFPTRLRNMTHARSECFSALYRVVVVLRRTTIQLSLWAFYGNPVLK